MPPVHQDEVVQAVLVKGQSHLSRPDFQTYWRDVHGPLTVQHAKYTRFYHYEQWHNLADKADPKSWAGRMRAEREIPHDREFEGVTLLFYKDRAEWESAGAKDRAEEHKSAMRAVMEDNSHFIEVGQTPSLLVRARYEAGALKDVHIKDLPKNVQENIVVFPIVRPAGVSREAFQARWRDVHGPIVEANLAAMGCVKYMQLHNEAPPGPSKWGQEVGCEIEGLAVVWRDPALAAKVDKDGARAAARTLLEDEQRFIDLPRSFAFYGSPRFTSAVPGSWNIRPYDGPVAPTAEAFPWFEEVAPHVHQRAAKAKL